MVKLISKNLLAAVLEKELLELDSLILEIQFQCQWQPGMIARSWGHIGIGILVFCLQGVGIGRDTQPICTSVSLSVRINIFFIGML